MTLQSRLADLVAAIGADIKDLRAKAIVPVVTALPANPSNGDEVYFQNTAMATDGIIWHLRYRAASTSPYKWEFVGGDELAAYKSATYTQAASGTGLPPSDPPDGPTITLPLAGEYWCEWTFKNDGSPSGNLFAFLLWNGTGVVNLIGSTFVDWWTAPGNDFSNFPSARSKIACNLPGKVLSVRYTGSVANSKFAERKLMARPSRVG